MLGSPLGSPVLEKKPKKQLHEYPEKKVDTTLFSHVGIDSMRHNGIHALDDRTVLAASGNAVLFIDLKTAEVATMLGPPEGGIGAVCVHPSRQLFAVCEKGPRPLAVVYEFPSKKRVKAMKNGAARGYSACVFNNRGDMLATVAQEPDFTITVWNWREEKTVLRNKAFGSDVYSVDFNPFNDGLLVTSGMGHIKFWTMAETFTGLKLQGNIGKFGRVEISDITGFISFPDGKVVSGSEFGSLLLWEGNLIKCELVRKQEDGAEATEGSSMEQPFKPCHEGNIPVVKLIENGRIIVSAASDGFMRFWSAEEIDAAETDGVESHCAVRCLKELYIGEGVRVQAMTESPGRDQWIILDAAGAIRTVPYWGYEALTSTLPGAAVYNPRPPVLTFNSGPVLCAAASPDEYSIWTGGADGTLRLVDFINRREIYRTAFGVAITTLETLSPTVDSTLRLALLGFADGTVRIVRKTKSCFEVVDAQRPHSAAVIAAALDVKGAQLFTVSADGTAFYFTVSGGVTRLAPVGFCRLPDTPTTAEWATEGDVCFVGATNGNIICLNPPAEGAVDLAASFEFQGTWAGLGYRQKQRPPPKEKKPGQDQESSSDDEDEEDEKDPGPWAVAFVRRLPSSHYAIGVHHPELAYTYRGHMRYPGQCGPPPIPPTGIDEGRVEEPMANIAFRDYTPLSCSVSVTGRTMVVVCECSRVLVRPIDGSAVGNPIHSAQLHDGVDGRIRSAVLSHDDKLLITVGADGMVFVQTIGGAAPPTVADAPRMERHPIVEERAPTPIPHSIQQQRELDDQKAAEDAALGKKTLLLRRIREVHREYEEILRRNDEAEGGMQLSEEEQQLDPALLQQLEGLKEETVAAASLEYSWVSAKKETLMQKLRRTYVDNLLYDRFAVHGFTNGITVPSLRTPHFTERQRENLRAIEDLLEAQAAAEEDEDEGDDGSNPLAPNDSMAHDSLTSPKSAASSRSPKFRSPNKAASGDFSTALSATAGDGGATAAATATAHAKSQLKLQAKSQLEKAEERKTERLARRKALQEMLARKPKQQDDDPQFLAELARAENFMGDYILKSDPNHVIPEHLRPTAERKAKQLILLEHSISQLKAEFNQRLLGMRDLKGRLVESINADRARIRQIAQQLKLDGHHPPLALAPDEQPEQRFAIDQEGLERFEQEQEKARRRAENLERAKKGFGADLASMENDDEEEEAAQSLAARRASQRQSMRRGSMHQPISAKDKVDLDMKYRLENIKPTELEEEEAAFQREMLLHEKHRLERRVEKTIAGFDESLAEAHHERLKLDADLTMADMRVVLLFREHQLLLEFQLRDLDLAAKLADRERELQDVATSAEACVAKVTAKEREMNAVREQLERAAGGVDHWLHEHFAQREQQDFLRKIFNRRIKRRKNTEEEDDDDDEATSEDDSGDDEEDGLDEVGEVCPAYCSEALWAELLEMREQKLDLDDASADGLRAVHLFSRETNELSQKQQQAKKALDKCKAEIEEFQRKKQKELNKLETIVVLKLSQIQCLTEGRKLPARIVDAELTEEQMKAGVDGSSGVVVFTQSGLDSLRARIYELAEQKSAKRAESETLTGERLRLLRRRARRQVEHGEWEAKVYEVQLLKFGQRVDLERLENLAVDRETEELKERLKIEEVRWERELQRQNDKLLELRQAHQVRIGENTVLLKDLGSLRAEQHDLEQTLQQSTQKIVAKMSGGSKVATAADRAHLKDLVVAQQQEIDALKNEIAMLRRKGGHVYTPVVTRTNVSSA